MKKLFFFISILSCLLALSITNTNAQGLTLEGVNAPSENTFTKRRQIGFQYGNNRELQIIYKSEINPNLFTRTTLGIPFIGYAYRSDNGNDQLFFKMSLGQGIEKHFDINKKLSLYIGADATATWSKNFNSRNQLQLEIAGLAGFNYKLTDNISLFGEVRYGYRFNRIDYVDDFATRISPNTGTRFGVMFTLPSKKKYKKHR